jgi:hypothetical protein
VSGDHFVEVTEKSWGARIKSALAGIVVGLLLVPLSLALLSWNEGRAVTTARSLAEGAGIVIDVDANAIDPMNDGQLVHVAGPVTASGLSADDELGVSRPGLRLERRVEMFQWKETSKSETRSKLGGGEETVTTYDYAKVWSDDAIDSSRFAQPDGHLNPEKTLENATLVAPGGRLCVFALDDEQLAMFGEAKPIVLDDRDAAAIRARLGTSLPVTLRAGVAVVGANPDAPAIGDLRITYGLVKPLDGSIVARQTGAGFSRYQTVAGDRLFMTADGIRSSEEMFSDAKFDNALLTWGLRLAGLFLLFVGFRLILGIISVLADFVPLIGSIVDVGVSLAALMPTLVFGPVTIAIAWIAYRPWVTVGVLVAAVAAIAAIVVARRSRNAAIPRP